MPKGFVIDFSGKTTVVIGGNRGIGYEISRAVAKAGATVPIIYRSATDADQIAAKIANEFDVKTKAYKCDVSDADLVVQIFKQIDQELGPITGVIAKQKSQLRPQNGLYDPRQLKNAQYSDVGRLNVEVKFAPFSSRIRRAHLRDVEDHSTGQLVYQSLLPAVQLHLFPKSTIDVFITITENDGLEICVASASMAASTALANVGIEVLGVVVGCCSVSSRSWNLVSSRYRRGTVLLAGLPALGTITNLWQAGQMTSVDALQCIDACHDRFQDLHDAIIDAIKSGKASEKPRDPVVVTGISAKQ